MRLAETDHRYRAAAVLISGIAGVVVYALAAEVFPYHTTNHDEAVYLQQAAMLLEGDLFLSPPVSGPFRPWFFVDDGGRLYPKYAPVPAAVFAAGKLAGSYRFALAGVGAVAVGLTYLVGSELFDRRVGTLAGALLLASPLFLVNAAVFLPYVPTTALNLAFAAAYLRADRTGSRPAAAAAGLAVGLAFFARPYTAVLFALPFVAHALWTLRGGERSVLTRQGLTAAGGLLGVAAALGYNAVVTGDPLVFPYEAFAPDDGPGFGRREILGYEREYTPALALRANAEVLWLFATRWVAAGALGTALAAVGLATAARRGLSARQRAVAGLFAAVPLGNVYFWGNLNLLGDLERGGDGLVAFLGPYYHVDLLVPTVIFAAVGLLAVKRAVRDAVERAVDPGAARRATLAVLIVSATAGAGAAGIVAADPIADNRDVTRQYEAAYEPFAERLLGNALVFLPTPYGNWLNHPFQALRNDPSYDEGPVFATRDRQFAVVDAFPDRAYYRYAYRGRWAPYAGQSVEPRLQRLSVVEGTRVRSTVTLGVPRHAERVSVRLSTDEGQAYASAGNASTIALRIDLRAGTATLSGESLDAPAVVPLADRDDVVLTALVDYGTGAGFRYRVELPVERTESGVRAMTPYAEVCRGVDPCGGEAAYVPGAHDEDVFVETNLTEP